MDGNVVEDLAMNDDEIKTSNGDAPLTLPLESPTDELKTWAMWQLADMGFDMEDSLNAIKILNCTDLYTLIDYFFH